MNFKDEQYSDRCGLRIGISKCNETEQRYLNRRERENCSVRLECRGISAGKAEIEFYQV